MQSAIRSKTLATGEPLSNKFDGGGFNERSPRINAQLESYKALIGRIEVSKGQAVFGILKRNGLLGDYYVKGHPTKLEVVGGLYSDQSLHKKRIGNAIRKINEKTHKLNSVRDVSAKTGPLTYVLGMPDNFYAELSYLQTFVNRNEAHGTSEFRQAAESFMSERKIRFIETTQILKKRGHRLTEEVTVITGVPDIEQMSTSIRANIVHACDGFIVRDIIYGVSRIGEPILPIHDCIGVRPVALKRTKSIVRSAYGKLEVRSYGGTITPKSKVTGNYIML